MLPLPSPSPSAAPPLAATASAPEKIAFKDSKWRPALACGGALAAGLLLTPFLIQPATPRGAGAEAPILILPQETTMIVSPSAAPGATLRGEIRLVADIAGRAPVAGQVARQLVSTGARVKRGDAVLQISSGEGRRVAPRAESQQNRAEQSQIAAADAQTALAQRVAIAETRLRAARERVERAQGQVGAARDLVRRLQNGEKVASGELPAPFRARESASNAIPAPRRERGRVREPNRAGEIALQQAQAAKDAAREGARDAGIAKQMLQNAQKSARDAADALKTATQNVADVEARFDEEKAGAADVEAARAAQKEAQVAIAAATRGQNSAKIEVAKREKNAESLQKYADQAAAEAKSAVGNAQLFAEEAPAENAASSASAAPAAASPSRVSLEQAIQFAGAALEESRRASRDADKIHAEIESYQRAAKNSNSRIAEATQDLASAQQQVLDSTPRPRFTSAYAPESGVVTWISRLAREVGSGESVFGIARGARVNARFEDKSDLWRGLKTGAVVSALVTPPSSQNGAVATPNSAPIEVKVTAIEAPALEGEAAIVSGEVQPSGNPIGALPAPTLSAGATIVASVARPGEKPTLSVPPSALVRRGGAVYIAVLTQQNGENPSPPPTANSEAAKMPASEAATKTEAMEAPIFQLTWQKVETGRGDAMRQEIVRGLKAGSRVVASTVQLQEMGLIPAISSQNNGNIAPETASEIAIDDVQVRLTPA